MKRDGHADFDKRVEIRHRLAIGVREFRVSSKSHTLFDGFDLTAQSCLYRRIPSHLEEHPGEGVRYRLVSRCQHGPDKHDEMRAETSFIDGLTASGTKFLLHSTSSSHPRMH